jgi:hypothetical protein
MKKRLLLTAIIFSMSVFCFAQEVEKLGTTKLVQYRSGRGGSPETPYVIYVDEINQTLTWFHDPEVVFCTAPLESISDDMNISKIRTKNAPGVLYTKLNNEFWSIQSSCIFPVKNGIPMWEGIIIQNGISFILKKGNGYIVYYVDDSGYPGAVDTTGRIYSSEEAMAYLKEYDPEKYKQSEKRAAELELYNDFIRNRVLVWGKICYKPKKHLLQYDEGGLSYSFACSGKWGTFVGCHLNDEEIMSMDNLNDFTTLIGKGKDYSTSWYVGFGGNIYYYVAGEDYTEVFRIRRTWGEPDFYAMAINGYTDDNYGKYVDEILPTLSKADLRLLRNTIFAIYGVHFKSADLSAYFDKQVWYTDEGKTSGEITLPAHRQKLVEMIQKLEKQ